MRSLPFTSSIPRTWPTLSHRWIALTLWLVLPVQPVLPVQQVHKGFPALLDPWAKPDQQV